MSESEAQGAAQLFLDEVVVRLQTSPQGLSKSEAVQRLNHFGPNRLREEHRRTPAGMLLEQYRSPLIILLLGAAIISGMIGEWQDTLVILLIVVANSVIGFIQDYRAERALAALQQMAAPQANVCRDGSWQRLPAEDLVPGDLVAVESGSLIPADLRVSEEHSLQVNEAALTGESVPVVKTSDPIADPGQCLTESPNLLFAGTQVVYGRGQGLVTATGMTTKMGHIAHLLETTKSLKTPLQKRLARVGRNLTVATLIICAIVFVTGLLRGEPWLLMLLTAVSLAVAAVPEALPAVVTISLALGARRLVRQHSLIRRLPAVETLGSTTCICSDKTGTLTLNQMKVERLYDAQLEELTAGDCSPEHPLLLALALNNNVQVDNLGDLQGDPTETALYRHAADLGCDPLQSKEACPRVAEIPFSSERQAMSTLHRTPDGDVLLVCKGSFEAIAACCLPFMHQQAEKQLAAMAADGLRVLAFAQRRFPQLPADQSSDFLEQQLEFLGLSGALDPPREESASAVDQCRQAGIKALMITGDHPLTALNIARRIGLIEAHDERVITGRQLAGMSPEELAEKIGNVRVFARVAPEQKIRIVAALQAQGEAVAMTGDGVNDAPALKRAEIGIAMGITGTDVAKQAAEMVLLDDNFATIVRAVREGRTIYANIRKFLKYTLTSNAGEIWTIFMAPLLGMPIPLLPLHILWINLITDGAPGLALAVEQSEQGVMRRPPIPPRESLFAGGMWQQILWVGLLMGGSCLATQALALALGWPWQTMVFTVLCLSQLFNALAIRSDRRSLFALGVWSNPALAWTVLGSLAVQLGIIYLPALQSVFHTQALRGIELLVCMLMSLAVFSAVELEKLLTRIKSRQEH